MADAIQIFKPGFRALDANGNVLSGATIEFHDAGTANARTVYADKGLSTALGTEITCDSGGYPATDANNKTEIYTGSSAFKVTCKDADGNTVWSHDNVIGALDTSDFLTDPDIVPSQPITNTSSNASLDADDKGKLFNVNCSGGDVTVTLDNASDLGNGWFADVRHDGSANQVLIISTSGELFAIPNHAGVAAFALARRGQTVRCTCDGSGFKVSSTAPPLLNTMGVINVADRLSAPPSAQAGARYILTSAPSGAWTSFAEHDLVEASGQSTWIKLNPQEGWLAWVADENLYYHYTGSEWVSETATPTRFGTFKASSQSVMEAGTSTDTAVLVGHQHYHPGHPKYWVKAGLTGNILNSYGVSSLIDAGTGQLTVNFTTEFSDANYCAGCSCESGSQGSQRVLQVSNQTASAITYQSRDNDDESVADPTSWHCWGLGDQ